MLTPCSSLASRTLPETPSSMTISGITIANGNSTYYATSGGGIATAVNLTLVNSILKDNQAPYGSGGGISNQSGEAGLNLTINNDLFENNTAGSSSVDPSTVTAARSTPRMVRRSQ